MHQPHRYQLHFYFGILNLLSLHITSEKTGRTELLLLALFLLRRLQEENLCLANSAVEKHCLTHAVPTTNGRRPQRSLSSRLLFALLRLFRPPASLFYLCPLSLSLFLQPSYVSTFGLFDRMGQDFRLKTHSDQLFR